MGDPIDTTQQVARMLQHKHSVACIRASRQPALETTNEALSCWTSRHRRAGGGGSSGDAAVSLLVSSVDWSVT